MASSTRILRVDPVGRLEPDLMDIKQRAA